jgi:hypothetical protein
VRGELTNVTPAELIRSWAASKVVHPQEEADPARQLVAHDRRLAFPVGAGEQDAGLAARRPTTTHRFGRPSFVSDGESSTRSNPRASTKNVMAGS